MPSSTTKSLPSRRNGADIHASGDVYARFPSRRQRVDTRASAVDRRTPVEGNVERDRLELQVKVVRIAEAQTQRNIGFGFGNAENLNRLERDERRIRSRRDNRAGPDKQDASREAYAQ